MTFHINDETDDEPADGPLDEFDYPPRRVVTDGTDTDVTITLKRSDGTEVKFGDVEIKHLGWSFDTTIDADIDAQEIIDELERDDE